MLQFEESLASIYTSLQKIAVGLEQVVWDQEDLHGPFLKNFSQAEQTLRLVLCEIQMALYEKSVPMNADVQRDIMTKEFRNMADDTSRNLRDFLIYRDFMNALEYSQQVFEYLKSNLWGAAFRVPTEPAASARVRPVIIIRKIDIRYLPFKFDV